MNVARHNVWLDARNTFLPFDGVVGVGYGSKLKGDKIVTRQAIIVLVERKLAAAKIAKGQRIPPTFEGLPTDVRIPRLTPMAPGIGHSALGDFCLTDYQWIDWPKIHRLWSEKRKVPGRGTGRRR